MARMQFMEDDKVNFSNPPMTLAEELSVTKVAREKVACFASITSAHVARINTLPAYERANRDVATMSWNANASRMTFS